MHRRAPTFGHSTNTVGVTLRHITRRSLGLWPIRQSIMNGAVYDQWEAVHCLHRQQIADEGHPKDPRDIGRRAPQGKPTSVKTRDHYRLNKTTAGQSLVMWTCRACTNHEAACLTFNASSMR
ncbi:uncharacterized protein LAESUDRAFT_447638 [Laetiporus sulphureus 93-53]|uniref:Uncharacterized protein n=1 Tax=Laetiporus sulphureus 93-53 TaxID=1314785 RepID=A0A165BYE7_9APHY|nr:uncharacterized protein LAESUDRAFT_447638 [Laetiporus sulphureus 93-53]KZT01875.1 hypothetical protein LAESUDRAFT_447638 [Laetiporus sulphureus 93-53]